MLLTIRAVYSKLFLSSSNQEELLYQPLIYLTNGVAKLDDVTKSF